ncbi:hypothetical protein GLYMA_15G129050v4 [Glycine max]|nr:hypothetical protein GLYMA_15G129050v4 [Glycine max]KAH1146925.1 hypothetical protein GYH30_042203 [Glycine max]
MCLIFFLLYWGHPFTNAKYLDNQHISTLGSHSICSTPDLEAFGIRHTHLSTSKNDTKQECPGVKYAP